MKEVVVLALLLCSLLTPTPSSASGKNLEKVASNFFESGHAFSAAYFVSLHLNAGRPWNDKMEKLLLRIFLQTGPLSFLDLKNSVVRRYRKLSPTIRFIFGTRFFEEKRYPLSIKLLSQIPDSHILAAEKFLILGAAYGLKRRYEKAHHFYQKCREYAQREEDDADTEGLKAYFTFVGESCVIHRGRLFYEQKKYRESLDMYERIPKVSYSWPYTLLEKAWSHYQSKNYNRSLGLLATYKSPIMENYFFPEGDVLRALSYVRMCYWEDAKRVVDEYNVQVGKAKQLKRILVRYKNSNTWFFKEAVRSIKTKRRGGRPFVEGLMIQIKKKVKFNRDMSSWLRLKKEMAHARGISHALIRSRLLSNLRKNLALRTKYLNHYIKEQMFNYMNQMNRFSQEMLIINVEVASTIRIDFYNKRKRPTGRTVGSLWNVKRSPVQQLYSFNGEFWADELGDYSFALKSKCGGRKRR